MKLREDKIEQIINKLENKGSYFEDKDALKKSVLDLTKKDRSLSEVIKVLSDDLKETTYNFLNDKNNFDINFISGISSCIYFPSLDGNELKIKLIGGNRGRDIDLKVNKNTMFDIASITKLFTLTLCYICENAGIIDLNQKVSYVNPNYNLGDFTFNDLIRLCGDIWTNGNINAAKNQEEAYKILRTMYLKSDTREENKYTDFGAIVLGDTIVDLLNSFVGKKLTLQDWMEFFIFNNLNMTNTMFNPKGNVSGNNGKAIVHDPKARLLGGAVGSAGLFTTSDDLCKFAKELCVVNNCNYKSLLKLSKKQIQKYGEITFPNAKQCNKGNLGIYVKHPQGFDKTFTPSEFSKGSFSHQGWTGSLATFDLNNMIHQNILVNAIYPTDNKDLIRNDKPIGFGNAFDEYLKQITYNTMVMYIAKQYYNKYCKVDEKIDITGKII